MIKIIPTLNNEVIADILIEPSLIGTIQQIIVFEIEQTIFFAPLFLRFIMRGKE